MSLKLRDCSAAEAVYDMLNASPQPILDLLQPVQALSPTLADQIETAIHRYACQLIDEAFVLGWRTAKEPELLIFVQDRT
jgi:hypothetical protein